MNTLAYLQFFDGLAEKKRGSFKMETRSSKEIQDQGHAHLCNLVIDEDCYISEGASRKEALRGLYRQLRRFR